MATLRSHAYSNLMISTCKVGYKCCKCIKIKITSKIKIYVIYICHIDTIVIEIVVQWMNLNSWFRLLRSYIETLCILLSWMLDVTNKYTSCKHATQSWVYTVFRTILRNIPKIRLPRRWEHTESNMDNTRLLIPRMIYRI